MVRLAFIALLAAAPAMPALAQAAGIGDREAGGAASGRSPHKAYRAAARADADCGRPSIAVPGGKLPHYGAHHARPGCAAARGLAAADRDDATRRD